MSIWWELLTMNWILSDPPNHNLGQFQQQSIITWVQYIQNQAQAGPKGANKVHEQIAHSPYFSGAFFLSSHFDHIAFFMTKWWERKYTKLDSQMSQLASECKQTKKNCHCITSSLRKSTEKMSREKLPTGQSFGHYKLYIKRSQNICE